MLGRVVGVLGLVVGMLGRVVGMLGRVSGMLGRVVGRLAAGRLTQEGCSPMDGREPPPLPPGSSCPGPAGRPAGRVEGAPPEAPGPLWMGVAGRVEGHGLPPGGRSGMMGWKLGGLFPGRQPGRGLPGRQPGGGGLMGSSGPGRLKMGGFTQPGRSGFHSGSHQRGL